MTNGQKKSDLFIVAMKLAATEIRLLPENPDFAPIILKEIATTIFTSSRR
jgi:SOS-response transcriptional repressor LexA